MAEGERHLEWGGRREGAGRKPKYGEPMVKATIALPRRYLVLLLRHGEGNLSEGVRRLVESSLLR